MFKPLLWAPLLFAVASSAALADQWSKSFHVGASPELRVETSDANVTIRAGDGSTMDARVLTSGWKIGPGDVRVTDHQTGDLVELEVKVPALHFNLGNRWVKIELQVPSRTKTNIHTSDGNIRADGLRGPARLNTQDGNIDAEDFEGALEASSGDGNIRVRGKFTGLDLHSGDGNVDAEVRQGSHMAGSWTLHTGDGRVTLRLPENFAADLEADTGDGRITMDVPLTTSGGLNEKTIRGKLNGGGQTLTIHTGDGSIHVERL